MNEEPVLRTPDEWMATEEFSGYVIVDPDGWNRRAADWGAEWSTPLTHDQFFQKFIWSTVAPVASHAKWTPS